jgi:hypothetical protein
MVAKLIYQAFHVTAGLIKAENFIKIVANQNKLY